MSIQVKLRRGTTTQHSTFTGAEGEVTIDTTKDVVVVHDGITAGGHPLVSEASLAAVATTGDYNDLINKPTAGLGTVTSVALTAPTGFAVTGSPVTTSGTLALGFDTGYSLPTTAKQSQWDTAYGWGNHASAGYLDSGDIGVSVQAYNANTVIDASYVHTDNNYTTAEKSKLAGIAAGAEVNVNADWNATSGDAHILNKPTIPSKTSDLTNDSGFITGYTETDPIFSAHPAHNVTSSNLTEWAAAYNDKINSASFNTSTGELTLSQQDGGSVVVDLDGRYLTSETDSQTLSWNGTTGELSISSGNTVDLDGRYLQSYTETDPIFVASAAYGITGTNISNWNTAYGWGNHASAGYLTSYTETDPVVGAINGLVKANGAGSISAATAGTDYLAPSAIGTTVQAYDSDLSAWAGVSTSSKQDTLVSGTNIKTVNSSSLLGSGDLALFGGGLIKIEKVSALPGSPNANTLYIVV